MTQLIESTIARQFDRLPPHSVEAEMCLLASMMLDKEMIGQVVQIVDRDDLLPGRPPDHLRRASSSCTSRTARSTPSSSARNSIKRQLLEEIGGTAYLATILSTVPSAAHGVHYAGIVREKALLRQLISASNDILRDAYAPHEQAEIVLDKAEKRIFDIAQKKVGNAMVPMESVLHEVFEMIENRGQRGVETGFYELDDMLNGLQNGEMIIVAARPSMGKAQPLDAKRPNDERLQADGRLRVGDRSRRSMASLLHVHRHLSAGRATGLPHHVRRRPVD